MRTSPRTAFLVSALVVVSALSAGAQEPLTTLPIDSIEVLARARDLGPVAPDRPIDISVSLPFRDAAGAQAYADAVSDPRSPQYRAFLEPEEVGAKFGAPMDRVERIVSYLTEQGFSITLVARNRLAVLAHGTAAQAERAFHTELRSYEITPRDAVEPARFFARSSAIELPADIAPWVIDVGGLQDYTRPEPRSTLLTPTMARGVYDTAPIFTSGMRGEGRKIGVSNFDGFRANNWLLYISHFALPTPAGGAGTNLSTIPCGGGGAGAGSAGGEGDLDIQMELGIAPLATIRIYDSNLSYDLIAVLSTESSDNQCDVISESYGWNINASTVTAAHNQHVAMTTQGITYMCASGDSGTTLEPYSYPDYDPEVLMVGGTIANVNTTTNQRTSEVVWSGSGGGWSTNTATFNVRPAWQVGTGVPAITGTNNKRLVPDLAFHAAGSGSGGAYPFYWSNTLVNNSVGTSFASPMFAGSLALAEQKCISLGGLAPNAAGKQRYGRIQNLIYAQNGRSDIWFDITSGGNGNLPSSNGPSTAHVGWDTVVGWGPMDIGVFAQETVCDTSPCTGTITSFCPGDDSGVPCPCVNSGLIGHGCSNSTYADGALLTGAGNVDVSSDDTVLTCANMTGAFCIFIQSDAQMPASPIDDGLSCLTGNLVRLGTKSIGGGTASFPIAGDPLLSVRGAVPATGGTYFYQVFYRNSASFCTAATSNRSNGVVLQWVP